ncbi:hypothetical protein GJ654_11775 [Rhodoblastus acidophilus]|uniref:HTH luxR-type domain-containing protein n=1 Tax=Rhodoblastus acidophilus TaxID=1074 RepID=A0A6N8DR69_RHOAC|nr:helix-turn-helix transcriptional regulator [Rhodoblastus acidophilus]MCW2274719.1 DNA-binding CsgD family transcriptional regulator [Rhodoblastus acidophilus]MTV31671.1 hypothetical protein [Rhodoblastus acidophilus]
MTDDLISQIYECAFKPERWPGLLSDVSARLSGAGASLSITVRAEGADQAVFGDFGHFWTASPDARPIVAAMGDPRFDSPSFFDRLSRGDEPRFYGDNEVLAPGDYESLPMFRDLLIPMGLKWGAGTIFRPPTGATIVFGMRRKTEHGPFQREETQWLDLLRPHVARATLIAARLQLERAEAAAQTLAALGLPALVCDRDGAVQAANALIDENESALVWRARNHFAFRDKLADVKWRQALTSIESDACGAVRSFPVRDAAHIATRVAHVVPIRRTARDLFSQCCAALVLTPVNAAIAPPQDLVRSLFDFTRSEASVAKGLAQGQTVDDMATKSGVSANTVRSHVRAVLEKTGCSRQADVVRLLVGLTLGRADSMNEDP